MKLKSHSSSLPLVNLDILTKCDDGNKRHSDLFPSTIRAIIAGAIIRVKLTY